MLPYHFYVQRPLDEFWREYGTKDRRVLFICGLGFDPRCVPAMKVVARTFSADASVETFCLRFTNLLDEHLDENHQYSLECLEEIRSITSGLRESQHLHHELEVNIFDADQHRLIGDKLLIQEFFEACGERLRQFTDVIVDISAFPRSLMYSLLGYLWRERPRGQNLFAVLTEVPIQIGIEERNYTDPSYLFASGAAPEARVLWIPVLGGRIQRFERIYDFLRPTDVFPIIPFPAKNPRLGDDIILEARQQLFEKWKVPFSNVMYASGEIPFDVFRKIHDIVGDYADLVPEVTMVVSALSGRSLSLGVLLAALWLDLPICHSQPTTYVIDRASREQLRGACEDVMPRLYWLDGELYEI